MTCISEDSQKVLTGSPWKSREKTRTRPAATCSDTYANRNTNANRHGYPNSDTHAYANSHIDKYACPTSRRKAADQ